ncbi:unnamed protein product, partial [Prorocentrum cordatum]
AGAAAAGPPGGARPRRGGATFPRPEGHRAPSPSAGGAQRPERSRQDCGLRRRLWVIGLRAPSTRRPRHAYARP